MSTTINTEASLACKYAWRSSSRLGVTAHSDDSSSIDLDSANPPTDNPEPSHLHSWRPPAAYSTLPRLPPPSLWSGDPMPARGGDSQTPPRGVRSGSEEEKGSWGSLSTMIVGRRWC